MTQDELDLCRLGMTIARMQLKTMATLIHSLNAGTVEQQAIYMQYEKDMETLCSKIYNGEIRGDESGQA